MLNLRKSLQTLFKNVSYKLFKIIYGNIKEINDNPNISILKVEKIKLDNKNNYNVFLCKNSRLYTDTINDTAVINNNKILNGPSFQIRDNRYYNDVKNNIVLSIGTPRLLKRYKGKVLSLLTGGGGNNNYWHWLYDVLPRIFIVNSIYKNEEIKYFLFPSLERKFQNETLNFLQIPSQKRISSMKNRHVSADEIIITDHPYNLTNNPMYDSDHIPNWILNFLRKSFLQIGNNKSLPKKIYIDRKDAPKEHNKLRHIINENQVKEFLISKGFNSVILSDYKFKDQVSLFKNADYIVGLHGSGLGNIVFCNKKTNILEIRPVNSGPTFENLSKNLNLNYKSITKEGEKIKSEYQLGDLHVDLKILGKKLEI